MTTNGQPIKSGIFIMPFHPPEKPLAQGYDEDIELAVLADELGFDEFWIGEHHTMRYETIVVPEVFIGRALGVTKRIRFGPAPICVNLHHPAYLATRLAFLDHLAHGRLNLCLGPSGVSTDYELYGQNPKDGGRMTVEAIDVILKLWASDPPYEHEGQFWQFSLKDTRRRGEPDRVYPQAFAAAPSPHSHAGHYPRFLQLETGGTVRIRAVFGCSGGRKRFGEQLGNL